MTQLEPDLPEDYAETLAELRETVRSAQLGAQRAVNAALIQLYLGIGKATRPVGHGGCSVAAGRSLLHLRGTTGGRATSTAFT